MNLHKESQYIHSISWAFIYVLIIEYMYMDIIICENNLSQDTKLMIINKISLSRRDRKWSSCLLDGNFHIPTATPFKSNPVDFTEKTKSNSYTVFQDIRHPCFLERGTTKSQMTGNVSKKVYLYCRNKAALMLSGTSLTVINGNTLAHLHRYYAIVNTFTRTHERDVSFASSSEAILFIAPLFQSHIIFISKLSYSPIFTRQKDLILI